MYVNTSIFYNIDMKYLVYPVFDTSVCILPHLKTDTATKYLPLKVFIPIVQQHYSVQIQSCPNIILTGKLSPHPSPDWATLDPMEIECAQSG